MNREPHHYEKTEDPFGREIITPVYDTPDSGFWTPGKVIAFILLLLLVPVLLVLLPSIFYIDKPIPSVTQEQGILVLIGAAVLSFIAAVIYGKIAKRRAYYGGFVTTAGLTFGIAIALAFFGYIVYMQMTVNGKTISDLLQIRFGKDFAEGLQNYLHYILLLVGLIAASAIVGTITSFIPYLFWKIRQKITAR